MERSGVSDNRYVSPKSPKSGILLGYQHCRVFGARKNLVAT
jgi:hypothetical protein